MGAPKGNTYWQMRKKHGKPKAIGSPEELWEYFCDYAARTDENPHETTETKTGSGSSEKGGFTKEEDKVVKLDIPYTWQGFEDYLFEKDVIGDLDDYRKNTDGRYEDYQLILKRISNCIYHNKFTGAAIGIFKENIIARDLGLKEKTESDVNIKPFNLIDDITGN